MDPIPPAHHQPRGLPYPLPTEDPQLVLGRSVILSSTDSICMEAAVAKKHLRLLGHTIRMPEHRLPRQVLYSQLMGAKRSAGGQKQCFKDYTMDLLKRANIPLMQLESLALDRSAWQVNSATAVSQIHQTNQDRRSERRIKRHQWAAGTPLVSSFPAPSVEECVTQGSDSNRRQHHWTHHHPWSKRHHRTRWTAKSVCVCHNSWKLCNASQSDEETVSVCAVCIRRSLSGLWVCLLKR